MQLIINASNLNLSKRLRRSLSNRIVKGLSKLSGRIRRVQVSITDMNGPKGGNDKQCQLKVEMDGMPSVLVIERRASIPQAIAQAVVRTSMVLKRKLSRARQFDRRATHLAVADLTSSPAINA
ncbi:hypothetical protein GCM10009092_14000 [Bowmanella denitrificans]|uniref:HPF/RaiA family ribosome-associated protein n=1 Tax=Bowmanella denitrificans TaxID=366582 RepID=A0ABN0WYV3_9ALTE